MAVQQMLDHYMLRRQHMQGYRDSLQGALTKANALASARPPAGAACPTAQVEHPPVGALTAWHA
eukprot:10023019-Prorocentrum_lima.AAC.1